MNNYKILQWNILYLFFFFIIIKNFITKYIIKIKSKFIFKFLQLLELIMIYYYS